MDDVFAPTRRPSARRTRMLVITVAVVVAVVIGGGALLVGAGAASTSGYRTATVSTQSVDQQVTEVGTIEPVSQATIAFPVSGSVAEVDVAVGDTVIVGQPLASLDTTALEATVTQQQAALDQAELTLERALNGESIGGPSGTASMQTIAFAPTASSSAANDQQLAALQRAVLDAQRRVDADLLAARHALEAAESTCGTSPETTTSTTSTTTTSTTTTSTPDDDHTDDTSACRTALDRALAAQQQLAQHQAALVKASNAVDTALNRRADADASPSEPNGARSGSSSEPGPSNDGASSPSSEDLIAYQKAVDAAAVQLAVARQALAQATITTPIAGTVAAVNISPGDAVTSASSTQNVVVVGAGGVEVTTSIGVDDLPAVAVGQTATVVPDGQRTPISGKVVAIGLAGTATSNTTTYPVVIGLDGDTHALRNGALATVTITTKSSAAKLAVPTSAVTTDGTRHTVTVLSGGHAKTVDVEIGAIGATWTEITHGLVAGQRVVVADLGKPLPNEATDSSNGNANNRFGRGSFPGGQFVFPGGR